MDVRSGNSRPYNIEGDSAESVHASFLHHWNKNETWMCWTDLPKNPRNIKSIPERWDEWTSDKYPFQ